MRAAIPLVANCVTIVKDCDSGNKRGRVLDGRKVEAYEVKRVVREEMDEDDPFFGVFDDDNFIEYTVTETHYRIVA